MVNLDKRVCEFSVLFLQLFCKLEMLLKKKKINVVLLLVTFGKHFQKPVQVVFRFPALVPISLTLRGNLANELGVIP